MLASVRWKRSNHVDRNANQHTLVEAWLDDLATIASSNAVGGKQ